MDVTASRWSEISRDPLSVDAIRDLHVLPWHYRISEMRYECGVSFPGIGRAGRLYVLSGACSKKVGAWQVELQAGTFVDFPAGNFQFEVLGQDFVQLVHVWLLPEEFRSKVDA